MAGVFDHCEVCHDKGPQVYYCKACGMNHCENCGEYCEYDWEDGDID